MLFLLLRVRKARRVLNELYDTFAEAEKATRQPQSSAMWDIKEKYQSDTGWQDAIIALNRMLEDEDGQHLPVTRETHARCNRFHLRTHRAKHGREVPLGADELFPIFVYVLVNSDVSQIPTFIEMMSRNLDQASKGAYYAITGFAFSSSITNSICQELFSRTSGRSSGA